MSKKFKELFFVEGNIGSGKSTLLRIIKNYLNIEVVPESVEHWQSISQSKENLLDYFYKDPKRWAYTFQTYAFLTRTLEQEKSIKSHDRLILERSIYADRYCFAKVCFELGYMSEFEWQLYKEWFEMVEFNLTTKPSGIIYLKVEPAVSYNRVNKRNRQEESSITLDYIKLIHQSHEIWIEYVKSSNFLPVLTILCDKDFEHDLDYQKHIANDILNFINQNKLEKDFKNNLKENILL